MKHLKSKLLVAIAMLLFASIMMTTATYAWFTISTRPEIKDLKAQVVVNDNLEIALAHSTNERAWGAIPAPAAVYDSHDTANVFDPHNFAAYTWGNVLDLATVDAYETLNKTLRPATLAVATANAEKFYKLTPEVLDGPTGALAHLGITLDDLQDTDRTTDVEAGYYCYNGVNTREGVYYVSSNTDNFVNGSVVKNQAEIDATESPAVAPDPEYVQVLKPGFVRTVLYTGDAAAKKVVASGITLEKEFQDGVGTGDKGVNFFYPLYGTDGRIASLEEMYLKPNPDGFGTLEDAERQVYGYYVDYWLRSNVGGMVTLSEADKRSAEGVMGGGSYLKANANEEAFADLDKDDKLAMRTLAENAKVAFQVLYDEANDDADHSKLSNINAQYQTLADNQVNKYATKTGHTLGTLPESKTAADIDTLSEADFNAYVTTTLTGNVVRLTRNKAVCVRMFVYLEGKEVTNAAASLLNKIDFTNSLELNVQFKIVDDNRVVENSMDGQS